MLIYFQRVLWLLIDTYSTEIKKSLAKCVWEGISVNGPTMYQKPCHILYRSDLIIQSGTQLKFLNGYVLTLGWRYYPTRSGFSLLSPRFLPTKLPCALLLPFSFRSLRLPCPSRQKAFVPVISTSFISSAPSDL